MLFDVICRATTMAPWLAIEAKYLMYGNGMK
jgi:hypothetical protein